MSDVICLLSGGLDSAVLVAYEAQHTQVHPLYVRTGLAWEDAEQKMLHHLLGWPVLADRVAPLSVVDFAMRDVYAATHWAIRGKPPAYDTPDADVYLAGRNLVLLTKAGILAVARKVNRIVLGALAGNPFPDATPAFFESMSRSLSLGLNQPIAIETPFGEMHKDDVIHIGQTLNVPFALTLSCMSPVDGYLPVHCGICSKCRERRDAFTSAGVEDMTIYAHPVPR